MWHIVLLPSASRCSSPCTSCSSAGSGLPALPAARKNSDRGRVPENPDPSAEWTGAKRRYDLIKEATDRPDRGQPAHRPARRAVLSPDEQAGDRLELGDSRIPRTSSHGARRARRDKRRRDLRPAVHPRRGRRSEHRRSLLDRAAARRADPDRPAEAFVLGPLSIPAQTSPRLRRRSRLATRRPATASRTPPSAGARRAQFQDGRLVRPFPRAYGPVGVLMANLFAMARSGALDGALISTSRFYQTNSPRRCSSSPTAATSRTARRSSTCSASQWGMMNETGNYPGRPGSGSTPSGTRCRRSRPRPTRTPIWAIMAILSLGLVCSVHPRRPLAPAASASTG